MNNGNSTFSAVFSAVFAVGIGFASHANAGSIEDAIAKLPDDIKSSGVVRVGSQQVYPPFEYRDAEDGELVGGAVDLLNEAIERLGLKAEWLRADFSALIPGITAGRFDITSGGMSDNAERQQAVDFVNYFRGGWSFLVNEDARGQYSQSSDFCGKRISMTLGSLPVAQIIERVSKECAEKGEKGIDVVTLPNSTDAIAQLDLRRVDSFVSDYPNHAYLIHLNPGRYAIAGDDYIVGTYLGSFAFSKQNNGLRDAIQASLATMLEDGTYAEILGRWTLEAGAVKEITVNAGPSVTRTY